jgi:hypothetical protein
VESVIETHLSHVELREHDVVKTLKPVRFAFVDQSTRERRAAVCAAEVEHNRPWAEDVYHGVITTETGEPAVHMRRLAADDCLVARRDDLDAAQVRALGAFLRERHDALPAVAGAAAPDAVRGRITDNLRELHDVLGARHAGLMDRIDSASRDRLEGARSLLEARATVGSLLHGDLRAEHVYLTDDGPRILDGVAFDVALASGDPIEDVAFLAMDLAASLGRWDLVEPLWAGWGDADPTLRALYAGHRSLIRAKVACLSDDDEACVRHLLHALVHWAPSGERPCVVGIGGLPGVGKSTVARDLAAVAGLEHIRTDVVRKELPDPVDYSDAGRTLVYDATLARAADALARGQRVVVDASFGQEAWRKRLIDVAVRHGVPLLLVFCTVDDAEALRRLAARRGDASDADASVHALARAAWEAPSVETARWSVERSTAEEGAHRRLLGDLDARGLYSRVNGGSGAVQPSPPTSTR